MSSRSGSALDRLPPELLIDRSNPGGGIRIVLKNKPTVTRVVVSRETGEEFLEAVEIEAPAVHVRARGTPRRTPHRTPRNFGALHEPEPVYGADDEIRRLEYVVVDLETTGGAPSRGHRVTEVAAVRMRGTGEIVGEYETLVNPERYIPPFITQLTNITPQMAADAPVFEEVAEDIRDFIQGAVFVAHNAQFDRRFLGMELGRVGLPLYNRTLCTVRLARKTVTEVQSRSLDSLSYFFGIENQARHRAMGDAKATALIFRKLLDRLDEHEVVRWTELESFLRRRIRKKRKRVASPQPMEDA